MYYWLSWHNILENLTVHNSGLPSVAKNNTQENGFANDTIKRKLSLPTTNEIARRFRVSDEKETLISTWTAA
jgi:hypothetical protein